MMMVRTLRGRHCKALVIKYGFCALMFLLALNVLNAKNIKLFVTEDKKDIDEVKSTRGSLNFASLATRPTTVETPEEKLDPDIFENMNASTGFSARVIEKLFKDDSKQTKFHVNLEVQMNVDRDQALLYGTFRNYTSYLTIGIPTVKREGISYLEGTLNSLIKNLDPKDYKDIVIVVFISDTNHTIILERSSDIYAKYQKYVDNGFIQIVHPDHQFYPDFTKLEQRTFNDSQQRVTWRCKQNIDYAYLMTYSRVLSSYYLQLEDDVIAAKQYFRDMKSFIRTRPERPKWFCLQFSPLGFIGRLFRSRDLQQISDFLLMFYSEQPGDLLLNYMKLIKTQWKDIMKKPSLFQHKGIISSLKDKKQLLVDRNFKDRERNKVSGKKMYYHRNPDAALFTSMRVYSNKKPEHAYDMTDNFFWGQEPKLDDNLRISFVLPQNISRLYIATGLPGQKNPDMLYNGVVRISSYQRERAGRINACEDLTLLGPFENGVFDTHKNQTALFKTPLSNIGCISIEITKEQDNWLVIREIAVFTNGLIK